MNVRPKLEETLSRLGLEHEEDILVVCRLGPAPIGARVPLHALRMLAEMLPGDGGAYDAIEMKANGPLLAFSRVVRDGAEGHMREIAKARCARILAGWSILRMVKGDDAPFREQDFEGEVFGFSFHPEGREETPPSVHLRPSPRVMTRRNIGKMRRIR